MSADSQAATEFLQRNPLAYAAYRINHILEFDGTISEKDEIPFADRLFFPVVLLGYIILKRVVWLAGTHSDVPIVTDDGHLFTMSSDSGYRTATFLDVAEALQQRDHDVLLLCSPSAESKQNEWGRTGFDTVSHRELHGAVSITRLLGNVVRAGKLVVQLRNVTELPMPVSRLPLAYNFLLLETVKYESVRIVTDGEPAIHSFSPMPYLLPLTRSEKVFAYQHGLQPPTDGRITAAPFFEPITYLLWGEPWRENFRSAVHPEARIEIVGSPWYETLAEKGNSERSPAYDVLFVSGSHAVVGSEVEDEFEALVENSISYCNQNGYSFAIKLHPLEDESWFEERGWETYITEYEDIDDALLDTRVSVTNASTAFVESAVFGVPAIVADLWEYGLDTLAPMTNVTFTNGPEIGIALQAALEGPESQQESRIPVELGNATERIVNIVTAYR